MRSRIVNLFNWRRVVKVTGGITVAGGTAVAIGTGIQNTEKKM